MSEPLAPAVVTDHRGRNDEHPPARTGHHPGVPMDTTGGDGGVRTLHLMIALLPAAAVVLLSAATLVYLQTASATGTTIALIAAAVLVIAVLLLAGYAASVATRRVDRRLDALRSLTVRGQQELRQLADRMRAGERITAPTVAVAPLEANDRFALLAYEIQKEQRAAQEALIHAAHLPRRAPDAEQRVEVFVNLARRMQSLVHREITLLDELEAKVEDPELLKGLFTVDHLATRMRRQSESLAVLGGASSRRQWSRPVNMYEVLRSAVAEVENYSRVKVLSPIEGTLEGSAVADVIHLVAELVENATKFSPPHSEVLLRAQNVTAGLAIEVDDRGLGIPPADQQRINNVLADPTRVSVGELLSDGRIGLFVVSTLARRHNIRVQLQTNIYGGTRGIIVLPRALVGREGESEHARLSAARTNTAQGDRREALPTRQAQTPAAISGAQPGQAAPPARQHAAQPRAGAPAGSSAPHAAGHRGHDAAAHNGRAASHGHDTRVASGGPASPGAPGNGPGQAPHGVSQTAPHNPTAQPQGARPAHPEAARQGYGAAEAAAPAARSPQPRHSTQPGPAVPQPRHNTQPLRSATPATAPPAPSTRNAQPDFGSGSSTPHGTGPQQSLPDPLSQETPSSATPARHAAPTSNAPGPDRGTGEHGVLPSRAGQPGQGGRAGQPNRQGQPAARNTATGPFGRTDSGIGGGTGPLPTGPVTPPDGRSTSAGSGAAGERSEAVSGQGPLDRPVASRATSPRRPSGERPPLPQRRAQTHLVPELREARGNRRVDEGGTHTPDLMAAFRGGFNRSEQESDDPSDSDGASTAPAGEDADRTGSSDNSN